tara:strand:+ start:779 stop:2584 length:1806 start_codon:yes stop_codon:yes gene_type:complete
MNVNYKKRIQNIFIIFLLISYLIIQFSGLNFLENQSQNTYCESLIEVDNKLAKNSNEIYFDFYNDKIIYKTLDIFPEIENIKCLSFESYANSERVILTSNNFYNLILILSFLVSIFLFSLLSFRNIFTFITFIYLCYLNITKLFFKEFFLNYYFLLATFTIFLYYLIIDKDSNNDLKNCIRIFYFSFYSLILIFDYELFQKLIIYLLAFYLIFLRSKKLNSKEIILLKLLPIVYYFLRILSGIFLNLNVTWQRLSANTYQSNDRYADGFYGLNVLNCNATGCDERNNYGPLWEYLPLEMNVKVVSIVLATFVIILMITIYIRLFNNLELDKFILQFLFISPPIVFGLERGQFDFHFVLISLYALLVYKKNKLISYLLICFAIQVKLYPIFLFAGMIFYFLKTKETKNLIISSVLLLMNSLVLIFYYFRVNFSERIQDQSGISQTYGIQSHAKNYNDFLNVDLIFGYLGQFIIILLLIGYFIKVKQNESLKQPTLVYLSFCSMFIFSSLIGNIDFRLIIFCIPLIFLLEKDINFVSISGLYLIASSPSMYFNGFQNVNQNIVFTIIETIPVLISHLSFLIIFSFFIYEFIFYFFKNDMFANK